MSDALLEWISFRGSGTVTDLPSGLLTAAPRRTLGDLSLLGHLEMTGPAEWRIAPPALACLPASTACSPAAIVCGARTPGVLKRLNEACSSTGSRIEVLERNNSPSVIRVIGGACSDLAETAARARMHFQYDAGYSLLGCVPSIALWPRCACQMAGGKIEIVRRFSGTRANWRQSSLEEAQTAVKGFFRIKRDWDWVSILKSGPEDCAYIDDRAGRMLVAAKRRHAAWRAEIQMFSLPAGLFPPVLIARALVLCSGMLPSMDYSDGRIQFAGVTMPMLRLALSVTGLRLA